MDFEDNILYAVVPGIVKDSLGERMRQEGWHGRRSVYGDWTMENDWSDLRLYGDAETFLNGWIAPGADAPIKIEALLNAMNCSYQFEVYNGRGEVVTDGTHTPY